MTCLRPVALIPIALLLVAIPETYGSSPGEDAPITTCNCVAFRLDDIQDHYLNQVQIKIMETFDAKNASLTIGVIANYTGEDAELLSFIKEKIGSDIDVANHGSTHEDFSLLSKELQSELLAESNARIVEILGVHPSVFIPPFNRINEFTLSAMAENNLHVVSASIETDIPFVKNVTSSGAMIPLYHFPRTAETGDISANGTEWVGLGHEHTMQQIERSVGSHGYAVVMMHPQEYSIREGIKFQNVVDSKQLAELELLIAAVRERGYSIVTVSELAQHATVPEFPGYLAIAIASGLGILSARNVAGWFRKDSHLPL